MKLKLLIWVACLATFFSCSYDGSSQDAIVGSWKLKSLTIDGQTIPVSGTELSMAVTFYSDQTWISVSTGIGVPNGSGSYTISGMTLTMYESGTPPFITTISKLNSMELVWVLSMDGKSTSFNFRR